MLPVVTPDGDVTAAGCTMVFPPPVAVTLTVWFGTGFPKPSRAMTVIVAGVARDAAIDEGETCTCEEVALTAPGREVPAKTTGVPTPDARASCVLSVGPVKATPATRGSPTRAPPTLEPLPGSRCRTSPGMPAASRRRTAAAAMSGVCSAG
jgi:hypothetical protein